ncbi:MAG TPA: MFS transporter [Noviherbaspirillum sp.]|nr:MFS transporter [Noviherbaspirillum sp.]
MSAAILTQRFPFYQTRPQLALPTLFIVFGVMMGSWAGRIPALRDALQLSHTALSMVLLCGGLGAVISYPLTSRLMATFGGRRTTYFSGLALLAVLLCIGGASSMLLLMMAVLALGITASCFDVGVNSVATKYEKTTGKSEMSKLHGWGCAGGLVGATLGSVMASLQIPPFLHFLMIAAPVAFLLWMGIQWLDADAPSEKIERKTFALPRGPLALLGALGFLCAMSEGSIADWSGVFLKDHFGVGDGFAPLALTAFSVMMLIARLGGDRLKERFTAHSLVRASASLAAAGLFFAVLAPNAYWALAGFGIAGLGLALVFPFVFSAAGKEGPVALAGVATMAYSGSLMGPPVVGTLAHGLGIQAAMAFVGGLSVVIAVVASRTAMLK